MGLSLTSPKARAAIDKFVQDETLIYLDVRGLFPTLFSFAYDGVFLIWRDLAVWNNVGLAIGTIGGSLPNRPFSPFVARIEHPPFLFTND